MSQSRPTEEALERSGEVATVSVDRAELAYVEAGEGEAVVFVHGALGDYRTWIPQVEAFSTGFRAISYSRRSHFPDIYDETRHPYTQERHADDLIAVLERLDAGPAHLVGHAYGGAVAALAAARRPDLVCDLVLAEPSLFAFADRPEAADALGVMRADFDEVLESLDRRDVPAALEAYLNAVRGKGVPGDVPDAARRMFVDNVRTLRPMIETLFEPPFGRAEARDLRPRTLFIVGELSLPLYRQIAEGFRNSGRRNARIVTLPCASHGLHLERPAAFSALALAFIAEGPGASTRAQCARLRDA